MSRTNDAPSWSSRARKSAWSGILVSGAGTAQVLNNVISNNSMSVGVGGGISLVNQSDALITNNFIVGNSAIYGGGIAWLVPFGPPGPTVVNNTIAGNSALRGSAVLADGFDAATKLTSNVLMGSGSQTVVECDASNDPNPPLIAYNDAFNADSGPLYGGICSDQTGQNGNISADPLFIDPAAGNTTSSSAHPPSMLASTLALRRRTSTATPGRWTATATETRWWTLARMRPPPLTRPRVLRKWVCGPTDR